MRAAAERKRGAGCVEPGWRPFCPPSRMPLSVGCTTTGRSLVGRPPMVGWTIFPDPFRTMRRSYKPAYRCPTPAGMDLNSHISGPCAIILRPW